MLFLYFKKKNTAPE